ncbi:DsbA family protein [Salipiger sp.]|uniref:DsbA family protein n=1 Tax=Salipiger sp. TaxID=2078585 RepID=UPI003A977B37
MKRILTTVALAAALTAGGGWLLTQQRGSGPEMALPGAASAQTAEAGDAAAEAIAIPDMVMGNADAPVEIIEYASFTCPHCARFSEEVLPKIKADYIDTGKAKLVFREVYFDKYGMWASMIARCGGEQRFFGIADMMFETQGDWARQSSEAGIADGLRKIGLMAGVGKDKLEACLNDGAQLRALVEWYQENATRDEITATPSFIIDGKPYSNMAYDDFAKVLDEHFDAAQ